MEAQSRESSPASGLEATLARFQFDDRDGSWLDHLRAAETPWPFGGWAGYELIEEVSRGGQGIVYRARQPGTRRQIALKRMLPGSLASPDAVYRFQREAETLSALHHPNIVTAFAVEVADGSPLLAMEWVNGLPITAWARPEPTASRPVPQILATFAQVCDAVHHAHQHGVIHRDLKPSNILIDADGQPHILDFGLAKPVAPATDAERTATTQSFVGTLRYASPEHFRTGRQTVDVRSDVYSLGVILYELLTGRLPYDVGKDVAEAADAVVRQEPQPPAALDRGLRGDLQAVLLKALAKEKSVRYQSAAALAADLRAFLAGDALSARPPHGLAAIGRGLRRYPVASAFAATVALLVTTLAVVSTILAHRIAEQRDLARTAQRSEQDARLSAEHEAAKVQAVNGFLRNMLGAVNPMEFNNAPDITVRAALDAAAARVATELSGQPEVEAAVRSTIGETYHSLGQFDAAEPHLRRALEINRSLHTGAHPDVAKSLNDLGYLLAMKGEYPEAESLLREALQMRRALFGPEHPDVATSLHNLGELMRLEGHYDAAEQLWREALTMRRKLLGEVDPDVAYSVDSLATCLFEQGKYDQAEPLFEQALAIDRKLFGNEHSDVADVLCNLGTVYRNAGKLDQAEAVLRESLEIRRKVLDPHHPRIAASLSGLACVLVDKGDLEAAEPLLRQVVDLYRDRLGERHPLYLQSLQNLAVVVARKKDYAAAVPLLQQVVAAQREVLGPDHPDLAWTLNNLAGAFAKLGDYEAAVTPAHEALEIARKRLGEAHPDVIGFRSRTAGLLQKVGQLDEAEALYRQQIEILQQSPGENATELAEALRGLGGVLIRRNRAADAESPLRQSLSIDTEQRGPDDWQTAQTASVLGECLTRQGRCAEAEVLLVDGHRRLEAQFGDQDERVREALRRLIELYTVWGKPDQAAAWRAKLPTTQP